MFKGDRNFSVGLFVSIAIAAFLLFVIWLTGRTGHEEMRRFTLLFERDVSGLAIGGPVKYMGMNIGTVVTMNLEGNEHVRVRVDIEVLESTPVNSGTYASIALQGITGVAVVNLASEAGSYEPLATKDGRDYPVIPVRDVGFAAVMSSMPEIMSKLDHLLGQAGKLLGEENRAAISGALRDVQAMTSGLAENKNDLAAIPGDLRATLGDIQSTVGELQAVIAEIRPGLESTVSNFQASSENLASLTGRVDDLLENHEGDMDRFMAEGLGEAPALMQETRQAIRQLEKLMAELKNDPSQLVHRATVEELEIDP